MGQEIKAFTIAQDGAIVRLGDITTEADSWKSKNITIFMTKNKDFFPSEKLLYIHQKLSCVSDNKWETLQQLSFKDPTSALMLSFFGGALGLDRFFLEQEGLGIAKLMTLGGLGIWVIIDWFMIGNLTREENMKMLQKFL